VLAFFFFSFASNFLVSHHIHDALFEVTATDIFLVVLVIDMYHILPQ